MNVIIVNDFAFINGGASKVAINTAKLLAEKGDNVTLFTAVGPIADDLYRIKNLRVICLNQYDILTDPIRIRAIVRGIWNCKAKQEFSKLLKSYSPKDTVIHIHTLQKAITTSIIPVAKNLNFKILYHGHDYGVACPNLGFYNYKRDEICRYRSMSQNCFTCDCDSRSIMHKGWRILRQLVQCHCGGLPEKIDCFIYISDFSLNVLRPYLKQVKCLEFLPNIVEVSHLPRINAENNNQIVFIGRLSPEKNPQIVARVTKKMNWPVMFIGSGILEDEIKRINPEAKMSGWVGRNEMEKYMQHARLLVFSSKWYEAAAPLTIIESMALGVPCIVSEACAGKEAIKEDINGKIFPSDDDDALIDIINELSDEKVKIMSVNAYDAYWKKNYNEERYYKKLKDIYNRILR